MVDITAEAILDSVSSNGGDNARLLTVRCRYPKFIHGEHLRHRTFSFSVSSSRAIPVAKNLAEVRSDELRAGPVWWGREQKGMSSGDELDREKIWPAPYSPKEQAEWEWKMAALDATTRAWNLQQLGAHKSIVNRILEPFLHVNVLVTGTTPGWMNFFGLRLDKAAQPEIRALAEACWRVWNDSAPRTLKTGEWHLPYADDNDSICESNVFWEQWDRRKASGYEGSYVDIRKRLSVARCAHLSYESFETGARMTVEQCLQVYDKLVGSVPIHASPAEHQATPDRMDDPVIVHYSNEPWAHPELGGNLGPGWIQLRKTLPGEAIAPLPEVYR